MSSFFFMPILTPFKNRTSGITSFKFCLNIETTDTSSMSTEMSKCDSYFCLLYFTSEWFQLFLGHFTSQLDYFSCA